METIEVICKLPVDTFETQGVWVARVAQLRLSTHGDSAGEAVKNLEELVTEFFLACVERGHLLEVLRQRSVEYQASTHQDHSSRVIEVPIPLLAARDARREVV